MNFGGSVDRAANNCNGYEPGRQYPEVMCYLIPNPKKTEDWLEQWKETDIWTKIETFLVAKFS